MTEHNSLLPQNQTQAKEPQSGAQIVTKLDAEFGLVAGGFTELIENINSPVGVKQGFSADTLGLSSYWATTGGADVYVELDDLTGAELTISAVPATVIPGKYYHIYIRQAAAGGKTVAFDNSWLGVIPAQTATADRVDMYVFRAEIKSSLGLGSTIKNLIFCYATQDLTIA